MRGCSILGALALFSFQHVLFAVSPLVTGDADTGDPDAGLVGIATYKFGKTSFDSNLGYYAIDVSRADFDNDRWFIGEAVRHELNKEWTVIAEAYGLLPNTRAGGYATLVL